VARSFLSRTARRAVAGGRERVRAARTRLLLPEATSGREQWQRVVLMREVDAHIDALGPSDLVAAEISGASHAGRPWRRFASLDFPAFDLCAPLPEEHRGAYDVVICEQVLEHVVDPIAAARNLRGLCRPGGHVIVSTPFLIRVHELPAFAMPDFWRFTPRGLRRLLEQGGGLEVDEVGTWGNRDCVAGNLDRWPAYRPWMSLRDEPDIAVQVWAFARAPG
jgi:SAM-dependent methyltransferase